MLQQRGEAMHENRRGEAEQACRMKRCSVMVGSGALMVGCGGCGGAVCEDGDGERGKRR